MSSSDHPFPVDSAGPAAAGGRSAQPAGVVPMIADASRRLQSVSERLRTFLQQKLKQFEAVSLQCESIIEQRGSLMRMKDEVQRDRNEWEARRQQQMDELRAEQDRLITAWQKLEGEQRQILVQQENMHLHGPSGRDHGESLFSAPPSPLPMSPAGVDPGPVAGSVFAEPRREPSAAPVSLSRDSALEQFQRLKHEIQKHVKKLQERPCGNGKRSH